MSTRVAHRGPFDEFADVVDAIVAGRVELKYIETGSSFDGQARLTFAAWLAFVGVGAVEHFGQNASS